MPSLPGSENPNWKGGRIPKLCERCGARFSVKPGYTAARFCSLDCWNIFQAREHPHSKGRPKVVRVTVPCVVCSGPIETTPGRAHQRRACSTDCSKALRRGRFSNPSIYSNRKQGRRADLGDQYFRSSWEANYARYLNMLRRAGEITRWEYEAETFWFEKIRRGVRSFTPDFKITRPDGSVYFVEVKGWMDARSQTKLKRMKKYHPKVELVLVGQTEYEAINRACRNSVPNWEPDFRRGRAA